MCEISVKPKHLPNANNILKQLFAHTDIYLHHASLKNMSKIKHSPTVLGFSAFHLHSNIQHTYSARLIMVKYKIIHIRLHQLPRLRLTNVETKWNFQ